MSGRDLGVLKFIGEFGGCAVEKAVTVSKSGSDESYIHWVFWWQGMRGKKRPFFKMETDSFNSPKHQSSNTELLQNL